MTEPIPDFVFDLQGHPVEVPKEGTAREIFRDWDKPVRVDPWMQTYSGHKFTPARPWELVVDIRDIAHSLALQSRYGGHTIVPYSVAQHCCLVHDNLPSQFQFEGLMHDATEAYVVDLPKPVKLFLPNYSLLEHNVWARLAVVLGLPFAMSPEVEEADKRALLTERDHLMNSPIPMDWGYAGIEPYSVRNLNVWCWERAEDEFLMRFQQYRNPVEFTHTPQ